MPRGVRFKSQMLENEIAKIKNSDWYKGHSTPSTQAAREMIEAIEKRIKNGTIGAHEAILLEKI